ncbi:hypothetical protein [Streptomyces sp. NPDC020667]
MDLPLPSPCPAVATAVSSVPDTVGYVGDLPLPTPDFADRIERLTTAT